FEIIDADRDGKITTDEIQKALKVPAYAQSISQLVIHYESEWFYQQRKWDALDKVLGHTGSTPILNWVAEKERIKELSWWEEVSVLGYLPNDAVLSFLNPIGILIGLSGAIGADDVSWLIVPRGQLTFDVEGNDVENERNYLHKYFSRIAHWPGGESGVTIGRGYDLGQRPFPEMDLGGVGIQEPLFSWLLGAKGLRGESAKAYLERAPENIKKQAITREQQYKLFLLVYDFMRKEVIRISGSSFNVNNYGILNWEAVDSKIQDVVVDLIYRGDYTPEKRAVMQRYFVDSDILGMRKVMSGIENWYGVPSDRYMRRREYLN
ncbi:pesticin C-terminus-like muramidase, partial [Pseudomonas tohonis]|nr:pesticin C-terminus-like muramidase [Pseudomonas tohonis]